MVDIAKIERFRQICLDWLGPTVVAQKQPVIDAAISISNYVDGANLTTVQTELVPGSAKYKQLGGSGYACTHGALIYGRLAIRYYFEKKIAAADISVREQQAIGNLVASFDTLFQNPTHDTQTKLSNLVQNAHLWLDSLVLNSTNAALTKEVLLALYTMLKLLDTKLNDLSLLEKTALVTQRINRVQIRAQLDLLMNKITEKTVALKPLLTPPAVEIAENQAPQNTPTINEFINAECVKIIETPGKSLHEKLARVQKVLTKTSDYLSELIAEKANEADIQAQLDDAFIVLAVIRDNERLVKGRKYALDLINSMRKNVDSLITHSSDKEQQEWDSRIKRLEQPNFYQRAVDKSQYGISLVTMVPTAAYRFLTPNSLQQKVGDATFATFDSETKNMLRSLAETRLSELQSRLKASKEKKEQAAIKLSGKNQAIKQLLTTTTTHELQETLSANIAAHELIGRYDALSTLVIRNQKKLKEILVLDKKINQFLDNNNNFLVKLSLFVSKIFVLFKTDIATKVEEIGAIKEELSILKVAYERAINEDMDRINNRPTHLKEMKNAVKSHLKPSQVVEEATEEQQPHKKNGLREYDLVKTLFKHFKSTASVITVARAEPPSFQQGH